MLIKLYVIMKSDIDRTYITNILKIYYLKINKLNIIMKFYIILRRIVEKVSVIDRLLNLLIKLYNHLKNYKYWSF